MRRLITVLLLLGGPWVVLPAQQATSTSIVVMVGNRQGQAVTDLKAEDFELKIDGKPVAVETVRRLEAPPLRLAVLVDLSSSSKGALKSAKDAVADVLSQNVRTSRDRAFAVGIRDNCELLHDWSDDISAIVTSVDKASPRGGTALYDCLQGAAQYLGKQPEAALKFVFLVSDGEDNASHVAEAKAIAQVVRFGIRVYAIDAKETPYMLPGTRTLRAFVEESGGRIYTPSNEGGKNIGRFLAQLHSDMYEGSYVVTFAAPNKPRAKLELKPKRKGIELIGPRHVPETSASISAPN